MIVIHKLCVQLGAFSLRNVSFTLEAGEYGVLMGKTGCGKWTILEVLCGLKPLRSGAIKLHGRDVTRKKVAERGIGYVPQDIALFTTMTVRDNISYSLKVRKWKPVAIRQRVEELAELLAIPHLLDRLPVGLSGGESQRVALGRALACSPEVLCLDEPLSALDEDTREEMYALLQSVKEKTGLTAIHVTHNMSEAVRLGDRLFVLNKGTIEERPIQRDVGESSSSDFAPGRSESRFGNMNITVKYSAQIKQAIGMARESIEVEGELTAQELVSMLAEKHGDPLRSYLMNEDGEVRINNLLVVGDEQVRWSQPHALEDGDTVTILPPISGGNAGGGES